MFKVHNKTSGFLYYMYDSAIQTSSIKQSPLRQDITLTYKDVQKAPRTSSERLIYVQFMFCVQEGSAMFLLIT